MFLVAVRCVCCKGRGNILHLKDGFMGLPIVRKDMA